MRCWTGAVFLLGNYGFLFFFSLLLVADPFFSLGQLTKDQLLEDREK
jgi:hypothetical protein